MAWLSPLSFLTEAYATSVIDPPTQVVDREGFEQGVPVGGTEGSRGRGIQSARRQMMEDLGDTYAQCIWVAACVDAISRSAVAGGIEIVPDDDLPDDAVPDVPPSEVQRCIGLFKLVNERQNITELVRGLVTDLMVFGDAYIEIGWLGTPGKGEPVRLWSLDAATMRVDADEHGAVRGYIQEIDSQRKATFTPEQVLHLSLQAPRGGLYGVSPTQKVLVAVRTWLWTSAVLNEQMKQGNPPRVHVDHPEDMQRPAMQRWWMRFMAQNRGVKNIANPIVTKGGAKLQELTANQVEWLLRTKDKCRDEILAGFGVPPNKAQIVESGNLGGGTGEAQDKTWRIDTVLPVQSLVLEALQFTILRQGFGVRGWHVRVPEIDMRDSKVVEDIRDMRLRNGSMSLNEYLAELGQPAVGDAGDQRILVDRTATVLWDDMPGYSEAQVIKLAPAYQVDRQPDGTLTIEPPAQPDPTPAVAAAVKGDGSMAAAQTKAPTPEGTVAQGAAPVESGPADQAQRALTESFARAYAHRRKRALKELRDTAGHE